MIECVINVWTIMRLIAVNCVSPIIDAFKWQNVPSFSLSLASVIVDIALKDGFQN